MPPDPYAKKPKKTKKQENENDKPASTEVDESSLRCTQTKPYVEQDIQNAYTFCINRTGLGPYYLTHVASVPVAGPRGTEEFCNMSLPGTASHASCLGAFEGGVTGSRDALLVVRVFELVNALRLGTLG